MIAYVAGFDAQFGCLNDEKTPLAKLHDNLLWVDASFLYVQMDDNFGQH
jgi:hypothetical protein